MTVVNPGGSADVPQIEDGLYQAVVKQVKDIILDEPDQFGNSEKVEIQIGFTDGLTGEHFQLEPRVNLKWGERATLYIIAQACGCECNPNAPFDTEDLVGKRVGVLIETLEQGRWPRVKTWMKAKTQAGQKTAPAVSTTATRPSVLTPSGELDTNVFWHETRRLGIDRKAVIEDFGGDVERIVNGDPLEIAEWLLIKQETMAGNA